MTRPLSRRTVLSGVAALSTSPLWPRPAKADWRPTETIRIVVPAAPGGSTDVIGRYLAQHLQAAWGQSAVVDNKSGAGGTIGTADFVRQKPDGHTILIGNPGPNAVAYSIFRTLSYKPNQLQPVSNAIRIPNIVSAHPSSRDQIDFGVDRLPQGQSGQTELRLVRRRAKPSPHRRLVSAAHRLEDDAHSFPRRGPGIGRGVGGRHSDPVRQPLSHIASGLGRQARPAGRHYAGA